MVESRLEVAAMQQELTMMESLRGALSLWGGTIPLTVTTPYVPPPLPLPEQPTYAAPLEYTPPVYGAPPAYPAPPPLFALAATGGHGRGNHRSTGRLLGFGD